MRGIYLPGAQCHHKRLTSLVTWCLEDPQSHIQATQSTSEGLLVVAKVSYGGFLSSFFSSLLFLILHPWRQFNDVLPKTSEGYYASNMNHVDLLAEKKQILQRCGGATLSSFRVYKLSSSESSWVSWKHCSPAIPSRMLPEGSHQQWSHSIQTWMESPPCPLLTVPLWKNSVTYLGHWFLIFRVERSEIGQAISFKLPVRILASKLRVGLDEA